MLLSEDVRSLVKAYGGQQFVNLCKKLLKEDQVAENGQKIRKQTPEDFSIKALWEGMVGPVERTLYGGRDTGFVESNIVEANTTGNFSNLIGNLLASKVIEGYSDGGYIGDELVTNMPSNLRGERVPGFTHLQGPKDVAEGDDYEDSTFSDKYVTTTESKKGRLLSVTREAVIFDQTGMLLMKAANLGEVTRQEKERVIVRGVIDASSTERVYRPSGTAEQLYASGNNNLMSTATPLVDWTDIQEAKAFYVTNVTDDREAEGTDAARPIIWQPDTLLVGVENEGTAARIMAATTVGTAPGHTTTANMVTQNPLNFLFPRGLKALSSPFIDEAEGADQWDDASDWLLGNFKKQFVWKEIWPLQVSQSNEGNFKADILVTYKASYYGGINAIDERQVLKVNAN